MNWEMGAAGYAAIWATENTREALWDAMKRKETYATTGTRMIIRFFGGWDFEPDRRRDAQPGDRRLHQGRPDGRRSARRAGGQSRRRSSSPR